MLRGREACLLKYIFMMITLYHFFKYSNPGIFASKQIGMHVVYNFFFYFQSGLYSTATDIICTFSSMNNNKLMQELRKSDNLIAALTSLLNIHGEYYG